MGAAGRVDLDLAQFRVSATDLRFAAGDQGAAPFLTIDDMHIDLPWAALWASYDSMATSASTVRPSTSIG